MASGRKSQKSATTSLDFSPILTEPQRERLAEAFSRGLGPLRVEPPLRASEWAEKYFWLSPESSAIEGRFRAWPYQRAILDCMGNDDIRTVTFLKSARIGYTKLVAAVTGYFHHHKRRNVVIYQPTDDDAKEFCKDTIDPMVRDCPAIAELMSSSSKNNKENTLHTKYFLGSSLHIRGGKSANNYRRLTKDVVIYDELDGFESDVDGEGSPTSLGDKRIQDSSFPKSIRGTTPTVHGQSLIQVSQEEADLEFRFGVCCIHCGERQHFEWGGKESDFGFKWEDGDPETTHYVCRHCHGEWIYADAEQLQASGRWEAGGYYIDDLSQLRDMETDELVEWPRHVCFVIWGAYSMTFPWPDMVYEFVAAKDDPDKLKTFVNTTLGQLWRDASVVVDADPLMARRESYRAVPAEARVITFGADVQTDRIEVEFCAWGPGEESWSLDHVILPGDTQKPDVWAALEREVKRTFKTEDGRAMKCRVGCVDSGYLPDEVYKFCRKNGLLFAIPVKGSSVAGRPIANMPRRPHLEHRVYLTEVGTDTAKETIYRRLMMQAPGRGYVHFPDSEAFDEEYFRQLTGEEKRAVKRQGRRVMAFQQTYARVEALDCKVYNLVAVRIAQQRLRVNLEAVVQLPPPNPTEPNAPASAPQNQRTQPVRRQSGWMSRYRKR